MGFAGNISFRLGLRAEAVGELLAAGWVTFFSDLVSLPAAVLAIMVVRRIDTSREEWYKTLRYGGGALPQTQASSALTPPEWS